MAMSKNVAKDFSDYASRFPKEVQALLKKMRLAIKKAAPQAKEKISYAMPAFTFEGKNLVYFAGYKKHIGYYPGTAAIAAFKKELTGYKLSKGTIQFPVDEPLPLGLVSRITKFRVKAVLSAQKKKKK